MNLDSDPSVKGLAVAALLAGVALIAWVALFGSRLRSSPDSCPEPLTSTREHCCAPGQTWKEGACHGLPEHCPEGFEIVREPSAGCVAIPRKIRVPAGSVSLSPTDWDGPTRKRRHISVDGFDIDSIEVTAHRYAACERAGACASLPLPAEPGLPMSSVPREEAARFCAHVGGRLPTPEEWIFAAAGPEGRRFPWGAHGLVCRRATYGLAAGPCAKGASGPLWTGLRREGATPLGILDLSGNVAEWTESGQASSQPAEPTVHGGSFRSRLAAELKSWARVPGHAGPDVGFRCVYAVP